MEKACKRCGVVKDAKKFHSDKRRPDGRSIACRECYAHNKLEIKRTPEQIESQRQKILGRKYSLEHRAAISRGLNKFSKEKGHHWSAGKEEHRERSKSRFEYKVWKEKLLERSRGKCEDCGSEKNLECHHVQCYYEYPDLRFDVSNGKVLCCSCHRKLHARLKKTL